MTEATSDSVAGRCSITFLVSHVVTGGSEAIARRQDHRPAQDWRQVRAHRRVGRSDRRRQQQGGGRQQRLVDGVLGGCRIVAATAAAVATFSADVSQPVGIIDVSVVRLRRSDGDASATLDRESVGDERGRLPTGPQRRDPAWRRAQEDQLGQRPIRAEILTQRRDDFPPSSIFQMISNVLLRPRSEW